MRISERSKWPTLVFAVLLIALIGAGVQVWGTPTVELELPANVYRASEFDVWSQVSNVGDGISYGAVLFVITVNGPEDFTGDRADTFTITDVKLDGSSVGTQGINDTFQLVGGDWVGHWGPSGGFPLPDTTVTANTFTVQMDDTATAPLGTYTVKVELMNLPPDVVLASSERSFVLSANSLHVGTVQYQYQFNTIQAAIDEAVAGDTVNVAAGTYVEDLRIGIDGIVAASAAKVEQTGLELAGADGAIIKGITTTLTTEFPKGFYNILVWADGVKIHGFTIQSPDGTTDAWSSGIVICGTDVEIYDNDFQIAADTIGPPCVGIQTNNTVTLPLAANMRIARNEVNVSGLSIRDNTFTHLGAGGGTTGYDGIYINLDDDTAVGNVTIARNTFTGHSQRGITTERSNTIITDNSLETDVGAAWSGINVNEWTLTAQHTVTITGNTITGFGEGIRVGVAGQTMTDITITGNTIQANDTGVLVRSSADGVTVNYNNISGNTTYGVENIDTGVSLDAEDNWWGDASGPEHAGNKFNVSSQGNAVSDDVDCLPWHDTDKTGTSFAPVTKNSVPTYYASIQAALGAAVDGDTITCAAGTFTEDIALNAPNVELAGAGATTIIQGVAQSTVWPNAIANIDVRGAGCVLHDFTARNPAWVNGFYSSGMIVGAQNVEVHHVTFDGPTSDDLDDLSQTFQNWRTIDISGLNLHDCTFTTSGGELYGYEAIYINPESGAGPVTIANNTLGENLFRGITTERENVTISGNTIVTIADPANAWAGINVDADNVTVTGNDVHGTSGFDVGVDIGAPAATTQDVTVNNNTIGPGNDTGIRVRGNVVGTGVDAQHNDIEGNLTWGIDASTTTGLDVNAIECWWGDVNGPSDQGTGGGDAVSVNVDFAPWLNGPGGTAVDRPEVTALDAVQSRDKTDWYDTEGDWAGGFWMTLDPDQEYHYLDVRDLATTAPLKDGYHEFFLDQSALPGDFLTYWDAKGVNAAAAGGTWQAQMYQIITGAAPMFYLRTGTGNEMLVDGLQKLTGQPDDFLRVNGEYPNGAYTFTGTVTETSGIESAPFNVVMTFYRAPDLSFDGFAADPDFVAGGAYGGFDLTIDNTTTGADYGSVEYELRIEGPAGETLTPDMFRLQKDGIWSDVTLTQDGDALVADIGPFALGPADAPTDSFRMKAQLGVPVGAYTLRAAVEYEDPSPEWLLREADQPFAVGTQGASLSVDVDTGWTMISVPIVGDDAVPETVFADVVASGQPLVIYEWVAGGSYHIPTEIDPGNGYWLYLFSPVTLLLTGDLPTADHTVALGLNGWHQISTPKWPVAWQDVLFTDGADTYTFDEADTNGWILPLVYWYNTDDDQYYLADIVDGAADPWTGYWLYTWVPNLSMILPMDQPYIPVGPTTSALRAMSSTAAVRPPAPPRLPMNAAALGIEFGNSPNPIRDVHTTTFYVKGAAAELVEAIKVQIFDQNGRLVYDRVEEGAQLDWHTDNDYGEYLSNGVYLYKLYARVEGYWVVSEVRKLAILR